VFVLFRRIIALLTICLWISSPLLACLPNPSMSPAEMECCKKMAGNCDMGGGNHKCCDTTANHAAPSAAIVHSATSNLPALCLTAATIQVDGPRPHLTGSVAWSLPLISPSPPGFSAILRI
jgi:hypothetical protein